MMANIEENTHPSIVDSLNNDVLEIIIAVVARKSQNDLRRMKKI